MVRHARAETGFFVLLFLCSSVGLAALFFGFFTDFVLAFMFTGMLRGLFERTTAVFRGRRALASFAVTLLLAIGLAVPLIFLVGSVSSEAASFYEHTLSAFSVERVQNVMFGEGRIATLSKHGADVLGVEWTPSSVRDAIARGSGAVAGELYKRVNVLLSNVLSLVFHFFLMLLIFFYMLLDGRKLKRYAFETSPLPDEEEELLAAKFGAVARATLLGNGLGSLIQGVLGGFSMAIAGLPSPILWSVVMTIFAFLPLVGVSLVVLPAAAYLFFTDHAVAAVIFLIFNIVQALFVENVIKTRLIGSHMQMPDLLIFLSIIGGLSLFGVLGLFYGPLLVAFFLTLADLYHRRYKGFLLSEQGTSGPS